MTRKAELTVLHRSEECFCQLAVGLLAAATAQAVVTGCRTKQARRASPACDRTNGCLQISLSSMESTLVLLTIIGTIIGLVLIVLPLVLLKRRPHKMTRAGLRKRTFEESEALINFINDREASRPAHDSVVSNHEYLHRRVTLHGEERRSCTLETICPR